MVTGIKIIVTQIKILQNQDRFSTEEYKQFVSPLIRVMKRKKILCWFRNFERNGFLAGVFMYLCSSKHNVIVTVGHRTTMIYGLLNRMIRRKEKIHVAKELYFESEKRFSIRKYFLQYVYLFAFKSLTAVVVNSSREIEPYAKLMKLPVSMFYFIPWPSSIDRSRMIDKNKNYIFAAGRSLRDWETFFKAVKGLKYKFVVVATKQDMRAIEPTENTKIYTDISYNKYKELLKMAKFVVIPLTETRRSSGQASFLEAMAYGKPVIVSRVIGALDYIEDEVSGLFYRPGDENELRSKISKLVMNTNLQNKLAVNALKAINTKFNKKSYAHEMTKLVKRLVSENLGENETLNWGSHNDDISGIAHKKLGVNSKKKQMVLRN